MDPLIIAAYLGLLASVGGNVIQALRSHGDAKETTKVSSKEANTHEFDVLREGMMGMIEELRNSLRDTKEEGVRDRMELQNQITTQSRKISTQAGQITTLTKRVGTLEREKREIIGHLTAVEKLVPNPPGVPKRPSWN